MPAQKISDLLAGRLEHLSLDELRLLYRTINPEGVPH
ncbi:hypothetical protein Q427_27970 [Halomonas sp. BC04]|nr:hypothetical protein Q427_27970 [Halomonas sp. BC04]